MNFLHSHFAVPAVEMKGEAPAVVQKEEWGACLYALERFREIWCEGFLVDGTHPKFVLDAVAGAHEFGIWAVGQFVCLL